MRLRFSRLGLLVILGLVAGACSPTLVPSQVDSPVGTPAGQPATSIPEASPTPGEATAEPATPTGTAPAVPAAAEALVKLARQDLAARLDVPEDQIALTSVTAVDWPDTSLGCPQPGIMYAQVITPGFEIRLVAGGQEYAYHTDLESAFLCENAVPEATQTAGVTPTLEVQIPTEAVPLVEQAIQDLATGLNIPAAEIAVVSVEAVQWRDSSLGCPEPGMNYLMVIAPGYLIRLEASGQTYAYHTGMNRVVTCADPEPPLEPGP